MKVTPIKTDLVTPHDRGLFGVLERHLPPLPGRSIVAVTSKIVAICEGRVVEVGSVAKRTLIAREAESFLPPSESTNGYTLTIRHNLLVPSAGIDESNGDGYYVLWPEDPQRAANALNVLNDNLARIAAVPPGCATAALHDRPGSRYDRTHRSRVGDALHPQSVELPWVLLVGMYWADGWVVEVDGHLACVVAVETLASGGPPLRGGHGRRSG